jgi:subtilase family serine protease
MKRARLNRQLSVVVAVGAVVAGSVLVNTPANAAPARLALAGTHAQWATSSHRASAVPSTSLVSFHVALAMPKLAAAEALALAVSNPASASYGHYLTTGEVLAQFAPSAASAAAVVDWLTSAGLHVASVSSNRTLISVSGTAARAESAFGVQLSLYRDGDELVRGADTALTIPSTLAGDIAGVSGINDDRAEIPAAATPAIVPPTAGYRNAPPCSASYGQKIDKTDPKYHGKYFPYAVCGYTPVQFRSAYGSAAAVASGADGRGDTVAIVDAFGSPTMFADANSYAQRNDPKHLLKASQYSEIIAPPTPGQEADDQCGAAGWYGEESLDVEAVHGMAPGAKILFEGAADCTDDALYAAINDIVAGRKADIITNSWGTPESQEDPSGYAVSTQIFVQAALEGIGLYFASGDNGDEVANAGATSADYPSSSPWVTAVGGTDVGIGALGSRVLETGWETDYTELDDGAWSDFGFLYGSGGGTSSTFAEPVYQRSAVPMSLARQNQTGSALGRVVPDISMDGSPATGMLVGQTQTFPDGIYYDQSRAGGTSLSSPLMAGLMAVSDSLTHLHHGFANPMLYSPLSRVGGIRDVLPVNGGLVRVDYNNGVDDSDGTYTSIRGFNAPDVTIHTTRGYDNVTGLGTPSGLAFLLLR